MIRLIHVSKIYHKGPQPIPALQGVTLDIRRAEFVAVMGPSGCGKSTLLHLIAGIDRSTSGEVWFEGQPLSAMRETDLTRLRREKVGIVYQLYNLLPHLTLWENVALPLLLTGTRAHDIRRRVAEVVRTLDLTERTDHWPHQLSGGEMQRAAVARAVITRPSLLLADEPTGNLDSKAGETVLRLLHTLNHEEGYTVVLATHSQETASYADRILRLHDGRILE
ncbi:MAG: ABC transporter ATP-binding protein [candidate division NC10 bacterium]|nr:ABC transporter ATP-binding protein [candidate division NC10 bacterium]MCH7896815.1 ABC transporter ATP-binding protein [candidate division NC10 bacterium]